MSRPVLLYLQANTIIQDIRRIVRNDQRIITKLHRRIFLDKLTHEDCRIYVSFYVGENARKHQTSSALTIQNPVPYCSVCGRYVSTRACLMVLASCLLVCVPAEAQNREAFMTVKQDLLLAFVDCVERNGARLAVPRTTVSLAARRTFAIPVPHAILHDAPYMPHAEQGPPPPPPPPPPTTPPPRPRGRRGDPPHPPSLFWKKR